MNSDANKIFGIQALRGLAALMVVACHVFPQIERMGYAGPSFLALQAGVDIFFVISGFIMWSTAGAFADASARAFVCRRLIRIVPLYWVLSGFVLLVATIAPRLLQSTSTDPAYVQKSFLFIPALDPDSGQYYPLLNPGWTLNYEMFFYAIFALVLLVRSPARRATLMVGVLAGLALVGLIAQPGGVAGFYTDSVVLEFAAGILLAAARSSGRLPDSTVPGRLAILAGAALLVWSEFGGVDLPRGLEWGLPATLIVGGVVALPPMIQGLAARGLRVMGDASYSIYLSHAIVMSACGQVWRRAGLGELPFVLFALTAVAGCVLAGLVIYRTVERPLLSIARGSLPKFFASRRGAVSDIPAR